MACKRSEQCEHADICKYAKSNAYDILGGSCYRPKKPQTNEEYIRSCSTEELAEVLLEIYKDGINDYKTDWWEDSKEDWMEWLKETHND